MSKSLHTVDESLAYKASPTPRTYSLPVFRTPAKKSKVVLNDRLQCVYLRSRISPNKTKHVDFEAAYKVNSDVHLETLNTLPHSEIEAKPGTSTQYIEKERRFKHEQKDTVKVKLNQKQSQLKMQKFMTGKENLYKTIDCKISDDILSGNHNIKNDSKTKYILNNKEIFEPEVDQIKCLCFNVKIFEEEINDMKNNLNKKLLNKKSELADLFKRMSTDVSESLNLIQEIITVYESNALDCVDKYSSFCVALEKLKNIIGYLRMDAITTKNRFSIFQKECLQIEVNFDEIKNKRSQLEMCSSDVQKHVQFLKERFGKKEDELSKNFNKKELNGLKIDCNELKNSVKSHTDFIHDDFSKIGHLFNDFMSKFNVKNQIQFGKTNTNVLPENCPFFVSILTEKKDLLDSLDVIKNKTAQMEIVNSEKNLELVKITTKMYDQEELIEKQNRVIYKLKEMSKVHDDRWGQTHHSPIVESEHLFENVCRLKEEISSKDEELCCVRKKYEMAKRMCEEKMECNYKKEKEMRETMDSIREHKELEERKNALEKKVIDLKKLLRAEDERSTELRFEIMLRKEEIKRFEEIQKRKEDKIILKQAISQRRRSSDTPSSVLHTPKSSLLKIRPINASLSNSPILANKISFKQSNILG